MRNLEDLIMVLSNVAPPFFASLTGALITFLMRIRRNIDELRDAILEAAFCVLFGTLLGYLVDLFGGHGSWSIAAASMGGMFGEKIYTRMSKKVETLDSDDILHPLSIFDNDDDEKHKNNKNTMKKGQNKGYFVGIGLNGVNTELYSGWDGRLNGAVNDIKQLSKLAEGKGFETQTFLDKKANIDNVRGVFEDLKLDLKRGDTLWIAYSGHGGQTKNDAERTLETYCLYDGQMADFEMLNHIAGLPKGVNVVLSLDCCHSGGFDRNMLGVSNGNLTAKAMPKDVQINLPDELLTSIKKGIRESNINMNGYQNLVILMACQKNQTAWDGDKNGLFTAAMLKTHLSDEDLTYPQFIEKIVNMCEPNQKPRMVIRPKNSELIDQMHFTI